jgi:hypothetical protein
MGLSLRKVPFLEYGSPSWMVLELFVVKRQRLETILNKEKGHILIEYGLCEIWLPERDAQQNFFSYNFGFFMAPMKRNHPRTEYLFHRI